MKKLVKKLFGKSQPCRHDRNYDEATFIDSDGCPMVAFNCLDCGLYDRGPVIMGEVPKDFAKVIRVRNYKKM